MQRNFPRRFKKLWNIGWFSPFHVVLETPRVDSHPSLCLRGMTVLGLGVWGKRPNLVLLFVNTVPDPLGRCDIPVGAGVPAGPPPTGTEAGRYNGKAWKMRDRTYERDHLAERSLCVRHSGESRNPGMDVNGVQSWIPICVGMTGRWRSPTERDTPFFAKGPKSALAIPPEEPSPHGNRTQKRTDHLLYH